MKLFDSFSERRSEKMRKTKVALEGSVLAGKQTNQPKLHVLDASEVAYASRVFVLDQNEVSRWSAKVFTGKSVFAKLERLLITREKKSAVLLGPQLLTSVGKSSIKLNVVIL